MSDTNLKTASVLAFERKLDPSDALFYAGDWDDRSNSHAWPGVQVREKSVRGTASHRSKTKGGTDALKQDMKFESPNPQLVDVAALPSNADTLKVKFTLRVLGGTGMPSACNNSAYQQRLLETVQSYVNTHGFGDLAYRYAFNLANGRFLWRNRVGAEQVEVHIVHLVDGKAEESWEFDALTLSLRGFEVSGEAAVKLGKLAALIESGLNGERHVLLEITAHTRLGEGQEVFPSQELILERGRGDKSKTLYTVNEVAGIHSQKLGNAIRTVDTWYPNVGELGPIAVEPYGSVTTQGKAYRQPKDKVDFYSLLDNWVLKGKAPDKDNQHYVMAVLVRGGVFGEGN